jgi:hypothetical protein
MVPPSQQSRHDGESSPRPAPGTRTTRTPSPVLTPWQASSVDPEDTAGWGDSPRQPASTEPRHGRRLAAIGLVLATLLGAAAVWLRATATPAPRPAPAITTPPTDTAPADLARRAADTVHAFLATSSIDDRARFVRHPEVTRARMQKWHTASRPLRPLQALKFHSRSSQERVGSHTFFVLVLESSDFTTRTIALELQPDGEFKVDWESFESWSEIPWTEHLALESADPVEFRVVAEPDTYYNYAYTDSTAWVCYKLTDPANQAHCWGYAAAGSETATALEHLLRRQRQQGLGHAKAILRLRFAADAAGHRQALIDAIVHDHWLKPDP